MTPLQTLNIFCVHSDKNHQLLSCLLNADRWMTRRVKTRPSALIDWSLVLTRYLAFYSCVYRGAVGLCPVEGHMYRPLFRKSASDLELFVEKPG